MLTSHHFETMETPDAKAFGDACALVFTPVLEHLDQHYDPESSAKQIAPIRDLIDRWAIVLDGLEGGLDAYAAGAEGAAGRAYDNATAIQGIASEIRNLTTGLHDRGPHSRNIIDECRASAAEAFDALPDGALRIARDKQYTDNLVLGMTYPDVELTHSRTGQIAYLGHLEVLWQHDGDHGLKVRIAPWNPDLFTGNTQACHPHAMQHQRLCLGDAETSHRYLRPHRVLDRMDIQAAYWVIHGMIYDYKGGNAQYDNSDVWKGVGYQCGDCGLNIKDGDGAPICDITGRLGCDQCMRRDVIVNINPTTNVPKIGVAHDAVKITTLTVSGEEVHVAGDKVVFVYDRSGKRVKLAHHQAVIDVNAINPKRSVVIAKDTLDCSLTRYYGFNLMRRNTDRTKTRPIAEPSDIVSIREDGYNFFILSVGAIHAIIAHSTNPVQALRNYLSTGVDGYHVSLRQLPNLVFDEGSEYVTNKADDETDKEDDANVA